MGCLHLISDGEEIARRRRLVPAGSLVEVWQDLYAGGDFWLGDESKALLDAAGTPLKPQLSLDGAWVPIYYGPRITDLDSVPPAESLQARALSAHGLAVAWITLDQFGERTHYEPESPANPVFFLRRPRSATAHVWRLFRTRREAIVYMREYYGKDPEAREWARTLPAETYAELLERHAQRDSLS
ncbi:MAG: hypothetical protein HY727_04960 [Candidatus Rokubacteria bacterium]|nr:hypothetical protein [Candidatus Rokubacteria bacterium]